MLKKSCERRIWELDAVKGFAFLYMVFCHFLFDIYMIFPINYGEKGEIIKRIVNFAYNYQVFSYTPFLTVILCSGIYVFVAGIFAGISNNNLCRGFKLLTLATALTLFTIVLSLIIDTNATIVFGILHLLGLSLILAELIKKLNAPSLIIFVIFSSILGLYLFPRAFDIDTYLLSIINIKPYGFYSADYYPIFPYISIFVLGILAGKLFYKDKKTLLPINHKAFAPLEFLGKHSLILYFLHQIVLFLIVYLIYII